MTKRPSSFTVAVSQQAWRREAFTRRWGLLGGKSLTVRTKTATEIRRKPSRLSSFADLTDPWLGLKAGCRNSEAKWGWFRVRAPSWIVWIRADSRMRMPKKCRNHTLELCLCVL
ncbi:hypothetical protein ZHAS_00020167 [Anopheles sinensis]|uniref:Uncharacterized protein n=1 Tax=Anopheles sinensis TaxID=74873 RepID=A0A084WP42_ANOSI|nr:hypothetical protein ZHAS_00020167 [Anopheles sinensis]